MICMELGLVVFLVVVVVVVLFWVNLLFFEVYFGLWDVEIGFDVGGFGLYMNLYYWINDGFMVVFFFVVGFEV